MSPALTASRTGEATASARPPEPAPAAPQLSAAVQAAAEPLEACPDAEELDAEDDEATASAEDADAGDSEEGETVEPGAEPKGPLYTADISEEELARRWKSDIGSLGSLAVGFVHSGRLVNATRVPKGEAWIVVQPELAWATEETVNSLTTAIREVKARHPDAPPLRVNQLSSKEGGHLRPHKSHQNGRDVDLGFYYPTAEPIRERERERYINVPLNWALIRALVTLTDVQMILVDSRVKKVIYDHALSIGEDKAWLDSLFNEGPNAIVKHAKRHRDHFHVRFHNPRAQELGRRVAPLLALQPEYNVATHKVRSGDTLGAIALKYGATVKAIQKANRMRKTFLRLGQRLAVPLRGPCTHCPVPPPVVVPPRRLPPETRVAAVVPAQAELKADAAPAERPCLPAKAATAAVETAPVVPAPTETTPAPTAPTAGATGP